MTYVPRVEVRMKVGVRCWGWVLKVGAWVGLGANLMPEFRGFKRTRHGVLEEYRSI
jgi:hypothetical protein